MCVNAVDILNLDTANLSDTDKKEYSKVVKKFNEYLKNTIFNCANFNKVNQPADKKSNSLQGYAKWQTIAKLAKWKI